MSLEMHPRLSVSALSSWNWTLEQDLDYWAEEGITSVGIWADKLDSAGWDAGVDLVAASGLRIGNVISAGPFSLESPADWPHQRDR